MLNIGVLVSGGGTNLQKLIDAQAAGEIVNGQLRVVIASRPDAYALERAKKAGIEAITLRRKDYPDVDTYSQALIDALQERGVDLVVLAGFLTITGDNFVEAFPQPHHHVHPALLPAFGGQGLLWAPCPRGRPGPGREGHRRHGPLCQRGLRRRAHHPAKGPWR